VPRYGQLYARRAYVPAEYRTWLSERVRPLLGKHGLDRQKGGQARGVATGPGDEEVGFPNGSLPTGGLPGVRPRSERPATASDVPPPPAPGEQLALI
jgi:hypothetical protein